MYMYVYIYIHIYIQYIYLGYTISAKYFLSMNCNEMILKVSVLEVLH